MTSGIGLPARSVALAKEGCHFLNIREGLSDTLRDRLKPVLSEAEWTAIFASAFSKKAEKERKQDCYSSN